MPSARDPAEMEGVVHVGADGAQGMVIGDDVATRRLSEKLEGHALFQNSAHAFIERLVGTMQPRMYKPGDSIVTYGEVGRAMFFIYKGTVQVIGNDDETVWAELGEDKFFGEIGVLFSVPRTATVRALTRCLTFVLTKDKLEETLKNFPEMALQIQREAEERFELYRKHVKKTASEQNANFAKDFEVGQLRANLEKVPLFRNCEVGFLHMLAMQLTPREYRPHEYIVRQGDAGNFMCFIISGHVEVVDDESGVVFATLGEGHFFGEIGVFMRVPRIASVRAIDAVEVFVLERESLEKVLPQYPEMQEHIERVTRRRYEEFLRMKEQGSAMMAVNSDWDGGEHSPAFFSSAQRIPNGTLSFRGGMSPSSSLQSGSGESLSQSFKAALAAVVPPSRRDVDMEDADAVETEVLVDESPTTPLASHAAPAMQQQSKRPAVNMAALRQSSEANGESEEGDDSAKPSVGEGDDASRGGPIAHPMVQKLVKQSTRKRRASVAVWNAVIVEELQSDSDSQKIMPKLSLSDIRQMERERMLADEGPLARRDLLMRVFGHLDVKDRAAAAQVCRQWHDNINDPVLLERVDLGGAHKSVTDRVLLTLLERWGEHIVTLDLSNCWHVTDAGIKTIAGRCPRLRRLSLFSCWEATTDGLTALAQGRPELESLVLSNCRKITDESVAAIATHCTGLRELELSYCKNLSDPGLEVIVSKCPRLTLLNLQRCTRLTKDGFSVFRRYPNPHVRTLILSDLIAMDDKAVLDICVGCPGIANLHMSFCFGISEVALSHIAANCSRLAHLDVSCCGNAVTDSAVAVLASSPSMARLTTLNLRNCPLITDQAVLSLETGCPSLTRLNVSNCKALSPGIADRVQRIAHVVITTTTLKRFASV
eukprot:Opistho-1_new@28743